MTYIFNKNLNQLFVYNHALTTISIQNVYAMLKQILVVVMFLVLLCIGIVAMVYQGIMSPIKRMLEFCLRFPKENYLCVFRTSIRMNSLGFLEAWIIWQIPLNI